MDPHLRRLLSPGPAEIIRAAKKDSDFITKLSQDVLDVSHGLFGQRRSHNWESSFRKASTIMYLSLTNLSGRQTLGEEYCGILQVDKGGNNIPGKLKLSAMIILTTFGYSTLEWVINVAYNSLSRSNTVKENCTLTEAGKDILRIFKHYLPLMNQLHLALFFLQGSFYHFSKRLLGIHYLLVRRSFANQDAESRRTLQYLMWISVINSFLTSINDSLKYVQSLKSTKNPCDSVDKAIIKSSNPNTVMDPSKRCTLCLEPRTNTTLTPCGHLFCWECILDWLRSKQECPICREQFSTSRVVPLQNYS